MGDFEHSYNFLLLEEMSDLYDMMSDNNLSWFGACSRCPKKYLDLRLSDRLKEKFALIYFSNCRLTVEMFVCADEPEYRMETLPFNYSDDSEFVNFLMNNITTNFQKRWFDEGIAKWRNQLNPKHFETLTPHGIAFTFNLLELEQLLHTDK